MSELLQMIDDWWTQTEAPTNVLMLISFIANFAVLVYNLVIRTGLLSTLSIVKDMRNNTNTLASQNETLNTLVQINQKQIEYLNLFAMSTNFSADKRITLADKYAEIKSLFDNVEQKESIVQEVIENIVETIQPATMSLYEKLKGD